jgi:hypothetical protein
MNIPHLHALARATGTRNYSQLNKSNLALLLTQAILNNGNARATIPSSTQGYPAATTRISQPMVQQNYGYENTEDMKTEQLIDVEPLAPLSSQQPLPYQQTNVAASSSASSSSRAVPQIDLNEYSRFVQQARQSKLGGPYAGSTNRNTSNATTYAAAPSQSRMLPLTNFNAAPSSSQIAAFDRNAYGRALTEADKNSIYFTDDSRLDETQKKFCRNVRHVAAKQDKWCLQGENWFGKNPETGKVCYNPYSIAAKNSGTTTPCFLDIDWRKIPQEEFQAEVYLKNKKGVNTSQDLYNLWARERQSSGYSQLPIPDEKF